MNRQQSTLSGFFRTLLICTLCSAYLAPELNAAEETHVKGSPAFIAIIIDDLGNQLVAGRRTIALGAPIACSVMPHTAYGRLLAAEANAVGKEVMLHLPMQPMEMNRIAGPGEISLENNSQELQQILATDLGSVPYVIGINNHMGSLITRHPGHMRWLMEDLASRGNLFFVDSVTTPASVAYDIALERGVPAARRDVFLDDDPDPVAIDRQFSRLKHEAAKHGYAIGIGHPYPSTLEYLEQALPELQQQSDIVIIPVSKIIQMLQSGELQRETTPVMLSLATAQGAT